MFAGSYWRATCKSVVVAADAEFSDFDEPARWNSKSNARYADLQDAAKIHERLGLLQDRMPSGDANLWRVQTRRRERIGATLIGITKLGLDIKAPIVPKRDFGRSLESIDRNAKARIRSMTPPDTDCART